jgi:hypothetical protein
MPFVIGTSSVHRIPPRVRDDREPPLRWDGTAVISEVIWVGLKAEFFAKGAGQGNQGRRTDHHFERDIERQFD